MSDWSLIFVPIDPNWQPSATAVERARAYVRTLSQHRDEATPKFSEVVEFYHPYQYWRDVRCPNCSKTINDDLFYPLVTASYETSHFADLRMITFCCQFATSLDRLDYVTDAAFGRFALEIENPERHFTDDQKNELERCIGSKLHKIWRHL